MAISEDYHRQVANMVRLLPLVQSEKCFALKGGTAINLFVRDLPRLSVDIDLAYIPIEERSASLKNIEDALLRIAKSATETLPGTRITVLRLRDEGTVAKVLVHFQSDHTKIEVTPVLRGSIEAPQIRSVSPRVAEEFGFAELQVLSLADLYGGKLVAALDRQHPRDLFDVRELLAHEGITDAIRNAFIAYLISHNRSFHEVLAPNRLDVSHEFEHHFDGMTDKPVTLEQLYDAREFLIAELIGKMPDNHRAFLLSFLKGQPEWALLATPDVAKLPAVRFRMQNLQRLIEGNPEKHKEQCATLEALLKT
jgi:predicted nucleotidyltransferase component of viral defense system